MYFNIFVRVLIVCLSFCLRMDVDDEDEVDGDGGFEAELALLDEVEADMRSVGEGPEAVSTSTRWSRPPVALFDPATDALVFQQFDVDFHTGDTTSCIYSMTCLDKTSVDLASCYFTLLRFACTCLRFLLFYFCLMIGWTSLVVVTEV